MNKLNILLKTFGCTTNICKTDILFKLLRRYNTNIYIDTPQLEGGINFNLLKNIDLCIINTCCILDYVEESVCGYINSIKNYNSSITVIVMGCGVSYAFSRINELKANDYAAYSEKTVFNFIKNKYHLVMTDQADTYIDNKLLIKEGCGNFCSYCMVSFARGISKSIPFNSLVKKIRQVESQNFKSIQLVGVCMSDWEDRKRGLDFGDLIYWLLENTKLSICGIDIHPKNFNEKILRVLRKPRISKKVYIPIQSASNKILYRMNRRYIKKDLINIFDRLYTSIPTIEITTDIIVGYPGENNKDFKETCEFIKNYPFKILNIQKYCIRRGTVASLEKQVPDIIKNYRFKYLISMLHRKKGTILEVRDKVVMK